MVPVLMSQDAPGQRDPQEHGRPVGPQSASAGFDAGWSVVSYPLAGMLVWGGAGWLLDRWAGTDVLFTTIGILLGCGLGVYLAYIKVTRS